MNIFVGNLPYQTNDDDLKQLFEPHGTIESARVISDHLTGRSKGFGFIEMPNQAEAEAAIAALNGYDIEQRKIVVNEARPKTDRKPRKFG